MNLPYGVRCEHCAHLPRCSEMFGKKPKDDTCDWWPRKFIPAVYGKEATE